MLSSVVEGRLASSESAMAVVGSFGAGFGGKGCDVGGCSGVVIDNFLWIKFHIVDCLGVSL